MGSQSRTLPTLTTKNLILRPYLMTDAADIQKYAGDPAVALPTLSIPHPYEDGMAEAWIKSLGESDNQVTLCVVSRPEGHMIGSIALHLDIHHKTAEIGYWIAKPYWGRGYSTEATLKIMEYGFDVLGLNCLDGRHFEENVVTLCVVSRPEGHMIGSIALHLDIHHKTAEIGYWIAKPYWGRGYSTEASLKIMEYGFDVLGLNCLDGRHFEENVVSGKVLEKIGMTYEGTLRDRKIKNGGIKNIKVYSILKSEYLMLAQSK